MTLVLAGIKNDESCDSKLTPPQTHPGALGAADDGDVSPEPPQSTFAELADAVQEDESHTTEVLAPWFEYSRCCTPKPRGGCGSDTFYWSLVDVQHKQDLVPTNE